MAAGFVDEDYISDNMKNLARKDDGRLWSSYVLEGANNPSLAKEINKLSAKLEVLKFDEENNAKAIGEVQQALNIKVDQAVKEMKEYGNSIIK